MNLATLVLASLLISGGQAASENIVIDSAVREINVASQVTSLTYKLIVRNAGDTPITAVLFCYPAHHDGHVAVMEIMQDREIESSPPLKLAAATSSGVEHSSCVSAQLNSPLSPGQTTVLEGFASLTQLQTPFPAAVFQNEPQRVVYEDNTYLLSPYKVAKQVTKVKLPSKNVQSFTKLDPSTLTGSTVQYGEYKDVEPFTEAKMRLHYENNTPFAVATKLVKEVEISHWGNVYIEERYIIRHTGAKMRGEWSRLDLMRDPHTFGQAAIRGFVASLPVRAHSIYFKDAIGNISTSQVKYGPQSTELIITPRYPLYGGWQTEFVLGYSIPLQDAVFKEPQTGLLRTMFLFGTPLFGVVIEEIEDRVVLPEGSRVVNIEGAFDVDVARERKYSYLDTSGRPVVVLRKKNVVLEHHQPVIIEYSFSTMSLLHEPLLLVAFFSLAFALLVAYNHCNFVITKGAEWQSSEAAERTAFLIQEVTAIVSDREKEVKASSTASKQDITALLQRLERSEGKLRARCLELEQIAGPTHSAKVRDLLEKERAVQAKISQIAAAKGQMLQKGTSTKEAQAKVAEDLQTVVSGIQESQAAKLKSLS